MIPFGLSSLMTVSMPIARRVAKCGLVPGASAIYLFDEGAGQSVIDWSGNENHGYLGSTVGTDAADPAWGDRGLVLGGSQYAQFGAITGRTGATQNAYFVAIAFYTAAAIDRTTALQPIANIRGSQSAESKYEIILGGNNGTAGTIVRVTDQFHMGAINMTAWCDPTAVQKIDPGWHVLAINWNGASYDIWLDGQKKPTIAPGTYAHATLLPASNFVIGANEVNYVVGAGTFFTGAVDTVALHPEQLTDAQVLQNIRALTVPCATALAHPAPRERRVLLTFDDGDATVYTAAYPIIQAAGMVATAYVASDLIGTAGYMTEEQIVDLYAHGWDIGNHTTGHQDLTLLTDEQRATQLAGCATYLDGLGLTRGSRHVAYPGGAYDAATLASMSAAGMLTGRTASNYAQTVPVISPYEIKGILGLIPSVVAADAKAYTTAQADGRLTVCMGHIIDNSGGSYAWTAANLQALINHLVALRVTPLTISQFYARGLA